MQNIFENLILNSKSISFRQAQTDKSNTRCMIILCQVSMSKTLRLTAVISASKKNRSRRFAIRKHLQKDAKTRILNPRHLCLEIEIKILQIQF